MAYFCISFCIFCCEFIFNRALFMGIMPWLRVGLRVLYFFCQMSQGYCKPETTFCVQFLPWGFSDHVVVQFKSQISLWKDLWLQIIKADAFFLSVQSFLIVTVCQQANFFLVCSVFLGVLIVYWGSFSISCFQVGPRAINSLLFQGNWKGLTSFTTVLFSSPQHFWPLRIFLTFLLAQLCN